MSASKVWMVILLSTVLPSCLGRDLSCQSSLCRGDSSRAEYCCRRGETGCCKYVGDGGGSWNNGGDWNNGGNSNNGNNNNKLGSCPAYNGRKKRSPEQGPEHNGGFHGGNNNGGFHNGGNSNGGFHNGGNNNGGFNSGGNNNGGFNSGHNNNGRCIRDSECPGSLKCCYLANGYQCTQPQYYGKK